MEVHPPDHPVMTWKQFFVHMAIVVLGLLIAIALEQSVEALHHRHQMHLARERIREELQVNVRILQQNLAKANALEAHLDQDLALLNARAAGKTTPGTLDFAWDWQGPYRTAYDAAHEAAVFPLLPYDEAAMYSDTYMQLQFAFDQGIAMMRAANAAHGALAGQQLTELSPADARRVAIAASDAREQTVLFALQNRLGIEEAQAALSGQYRNDFNGSSSH